MAKHFTELSIAAFRGIKDLDITDLSDVNIIVGDNNSGKTSILEAIQLISDPVEYNFFRVAGLRVNTNSTSNVALIETTSSVMHKSTDDNDNESYSLEISAVSTKENKNQSYIKATAKYVSVLTNTNELTFLELDFSSSNGIKSITQIGSPTLKHKSHLNFIEEMTRPLNYTPDVNVGALYAIDHVIGTDYEKIINNKSQTKKAINLLKGFNESIIDMRYLNKNGAAVPVVDTDIREAAPLSDYGDGLKKALAMMGTLLKAENGILLIDEYESAIHPSAMNNVFSFILKACKELNVQIFMTTHSIEAIDKLLCCNEAELDNVRVITLKKKNGKTYSRIINGLEAEQLRLNNEAELR